MANALAFLLDPEYWKSVRQTAPNSLAGLVKGITAGTVGAPVDIANMVMQPFGLGSERPVGGSNSLGKLMSADTESTPYQIGSMLPVSPADLAQGIPVMAGMVMSKGGKAADALNYSDDVARSVPKSELNNLNPTGGLYANYAPELRAIQPRVPKYQYALEKARAEQSRSNAFDIEAEKKIIAENGDADLSSIFKNPKLWDSENEQITQAGLAEMDKIHTQKAIDNLRLPSIDDIYGLDKANHKAQYEAMKSILDEKGIPYVDTSSAQSKYLEVGGKKLRFADHPNMVRDSAVRGSLPIINVSPSEYKFSDALAHVESIEPIVSKNGGYK